MGGGGGGGGGGDGLNQSNDTVFITRTNFFPNTSSLRRQARVKADDLSQVACSIWQSTRHVQHVA